MLSKAGKHGLGRVLINHGDGDVPEVVLGASRDEQHQHSTTRWSRSIAMWDAVWKQNEGAGFRSDQGFSAHELVRAVENVEGLVDGVVNVEWRPSIGRVRGLDSENWPRVSDTGALMTISARHDTFSPAPAGRNTNPSGQATRALFHVAKR